MKTSKLLFVILVVIAMFGITSIAGATCGNYGKIMYTYRTSSGTMYVYVTPNRTSFPTYYYYFTTSQNNYQVMDQLTSAQAGNYTVYLNGNASSCASSGTYRYGGVINYSITYTMY